MGQLSIQVLLRNVIIDMNLTCMTENFFLHEIVGQLRFMY